MSLEVVLVVPVLMLLALFVLWAGRGGRAALMADLAAEEAATAAAVTCEDDEDDECEGFVTDVLSARPGMDFLCIGGPRPDGDAVVRYEEVVFPAVPGEPGSEAKGAAVVGVRFVCETDGAVAPLAGVFPTVAFRGQASEVAILQGAPRAGVADVEVTEGDVDDDGNPVPLVFTVTLDAPASGDVEFKYEVEALTPHTNVPADYGPLDPTKTVTVLDGRTRAEIEVEVGDDDVHEAAERLQLTLMVVDPTPDILDDPLPAVFEDGAESVTAVGTILDNDPAPLLTVSDAGFEPDPVREGGGGALVFTVALEPVGRDVVVDYSTADVSGDGGATGGDICVVGGDADYLSHSDVELTFGPSDNQQTHDIEVTLCDDLRGEPDETLELRLTLHGGAQMALIDGSVRCQAAAHGGGDGDSCAVGLISDDEPRLAVADTCTDLTALGDDDEVDQAGIEAVHACVREDAGPLVFTVERRDGGSGDHPEVTVTYVTEPNPETFVGTHDATAGGADSLDDCDARPLKLAGAGEHHDFVPASGTLTIAADEANWQQTVEVDIIDDGLDEHPETFWLRLCRASDNAWVEQGEQWGRGLIADDDDPPAVSVSDDTVEEGDDADGDGDPDPAVFMVSLDTPSGRDVTVDYYTDHRSLYEGADPPVAVPADVGGLTAEPGEDYEQRPKEPSDDRAKVIFEAGETGPKPARVSVVDDDVYEPDDETLAVRLFAYNARFADDSGSCAPAGPDGENTGNDCALGTITDNDEPPFVRVSDAAAVEGEPLVFTVSLVDADGSDVDADGGPVVSGRDIAVEYSVHHRSTKAGDFAAGEPLTGTVEIAAGESSAVVTLDTLDDGLDEFDEEVFELRLSIPEAAEDHVRMHPTAAAGGCLSVADGDAGIDGCGVGAIADDDPSPYLRIDDAADVTEGADSDGDGDPDRAVFTVSLVDIDGSTTDAGGDRWVSGRDVTVAYRTQELGDPPGDGCAANEPATAGEDFAAAAGVTVTILEGASSALITVEVLDDEVDECRREVFQVRLDGAHADSAGFEAIHDGGIATGAVIDDDDVLVRVVADGDCEPGVDACAAEGDDGDPANAVAFTLGLFDADTDDAVSTAVDVTVQYCTVGGTDDHAAVRGTDFATQASCPDDWVDFTIDAGDETAVLELATVPDDVYELDETFLLRLKATDDANATVGDAAAVGAILNDDAAPRVSVADAAATEGDTVVFDLRLLDADGDEAQIGRSVTVDWATAGTGTGIGHATGSGDGADYVPATGRVTFDPQDADPAAQTVSVATVDERVDEDAETFELRLTLPDGEEATLDTGPDPCAPEPDGAAEAPSDDCAVGTIEPDGDPAPLAMLSGAAATEGDELVFTVTLVDPEATAEALPSGRQVTVRARTAGPAAADAVSNAHGTAYSGACGAALGHDPLFGFLEPVADFGHTELEAVIEPGDTTAQMRVATCDDLLDEAEETMHLELTGADNASVGDPGAEGRRGAGTIADNDPTPAAVVDDAAATEGDPVQFTPRLVHPDDTAKEPADQRAAPSDRDITINYHTYSDPSSADFTATPDGPDRDYTAVPQTPRRTATVHAGRDQPAAGPIEIATRADSTSEGAEKFQLRLTLDSDQPADLADPTAVGTIEDGCLDPANPQHTAPPLTIEAPSTVDEDGGPHGWRIRWDATLCPSTHTSLRTNTELDTADRSDFTASVWGEGGSGVEALSASQGYRPHTTMWVANDDVDEEDEKFILRVRWAPGPQFGAADAWIVNPGWTTAEVTIIDDDPAPAVVVDDASGPESTDIVFTPRLVHPDDTAKDPADQRTALSDQDITVEYHTYGDPDSPNLGATPGDDYAHVPETPAQSVTVPALAAAAAEPIAIAARPDDHKDEGDEKFQLRLALPDGTRAQLAGGGIAVGTITECIDPATHQEGGIVAEMVPASDGDPQALENAGHITFELTFEPRLCDGARAHINWWTEGISIDFQVSAGNYDPMQGDGAAHHYDFIDIQDGERSWIIQGGDNRFEIEVPLVDDHIDEPLTEQFTLSVVGGDTMPEAYQFQSNSGWNTAFEGFIIDDDDLIVSVDPAAAAEGSPVRFEVHATPSERRVNVSSNTFERLEGDAIARAGDCDTDDDADYEHTEHILVFEPVTDPGAYGAGSRVTKTIDIETCDDDRAENNETFLLQSTLTVDDPPAVYPDADVPDPADPANRGTLHGATRDGTITDAGLRIAVTSGPPVNEGQQANFTLTLVDVAGDRAEPDDTVTVDVATADLSADHSNYDDAATAGDDYTPVPLRTVTFNPFDPNPDGRSQQTVPVATTTDSVYDDGEQFLLEVSNPRGADLASDDDNDGRIEGTAVIQDCIDATLPPSTEHPPTLSGPDIEVPEDVGTASFFFKLSPSPLCERRSTVFAQHHVSTTYADVTTINSGSGGFGEGDRHSVSHDETIIDDNQPEANETFETETHFCRLPHREFCNLNGGQNERWHPGFAELPSATATVTIIDNDRVSVSVSSPEPVPEGDPVEFEVSLSGDTAEAVTVQYATEDAPGGPGGAGVATGGADYTPLDSSDAANAAQPLVFEPGGPLTQTVPVATIEDAADDEPDETFRLRLTEAENAVLAGGDDTYGTGTITDCIDTTQPPDTVNPPQIALDAPASITEGDTATITITVMSPAFCEPKTLGFVTSAHTSPPSPPQTPLAETADVTWGIMQGGIGIPGPTGGTNSRRYRFEDDDVSEGTEYFYFTIYFCGKYNRCTLKSNSRVSFHPDWSTLPLFTATIAIEDNDVPVVSVSDGIGPGGGVGGVEGEALVFTVSLDRPSSRIVTVDYGFVDLEATVVTDYTGIPGRLTFEPGEPLTQTVTVELVVDDVDDNDEGDERFRMRLFRLDNAGFGDRSGIGTILGSGLPEVSVSDGIGPGGGVGGVEGETLEFRVELDRASSRTVTVDYGFSDVTTTSGDYTASPGTLTFEPGEPLTQTVPVALVVDDVAERVERFRMRLISPVNAGLGEDIGEGTIDADPPPVVSVSDGIGPGGGLGGVGGETLVFTVSLNPRSDRTVTVGYEFSDVTTTSDDYTASPGTLTFEPGEPLTQTVPVALVVDGDEGVERFQMRLMSPVNAELGDYIGEGTIIGSALPVVGFASGYRSYQVAAGQTVTVELELSAPSARTVVVGVATEDGTAQDGVHYQGRTRPVSFGPGRERARSTIYTLAGSVGTGEYKHFTVRLADPSNAELDTGPGASLVDSATVRVAGPHPDCVNPATDDPPAMSFQDARIPEGTTGVHIALTLTPPLCGMQPRGTLQYRTNRVTSEEGDHTSHPAWSPTGEVLAGQAVALVFEFHTVHDTDRDDEIFEYQARWNADGPASRWAGEPPAISRIVIEDVGG